MSILDSLEMKDRRTKAAAAVTADMIREEILRHAKNFKTSWISLGQNLYPVWKDKLYHGWGFEKFEDYVEDELGMKKGNALKLLKTYFFIEQEEPQYLSEDFQERRQARVPDCDAVNVLRLARQKKELTKDDYRELRKSVFDDGKSAALARKDLTALIKERKVVDPDEERQKRSDAVVQRLLATIKTFKQEMDVLKLVPADLIDEAEALMKRLEQELK